MIRIRYQIYQFSILINPAYLYTVENCQSNEQWNIDDKNTLSDITILDSDQSGLLVYCRELSV